MEQNSQLKWEAKVTAKLTRASPDQIWGIYTDFFNFHKWYPGLASCRGIHGTNGEVGCIRFCSGFSISSSSQGTGSGKWSKERLIAIDHSRRCLSYEMVDSNIGFKSYVSTVKIVPWGDDGDDHEHDQDGCVIEWSFTVDPVEGLQLDEMMKKYEVALQSLVKRIEDVIFDL